LPNVKAVLMSFFGYYTHHIVIGIFHWHNPSGRTVALGSPQPVTEMSARNIS